MPIHDISYQHWQGAHIGLWRRRLAIAQNGITAGLRNKWLRHALVLCWGAALAMTGILFLIGQLLVADSVVVQWLGNLNPMLQTFGRTLTTWLEQHPEISVRTTQNVLFYFFCVYLMRAGIFILGMAVPTLITQDLASNAIIIYSSKAISRGDYLLGKFCAAFGILIMAWLGPLMAAWFLGNLLTPDWGFFWHSRTALIHLAMFGLLAAAALSLLAMGVSAIASKDKSTTSIWYVWWILGGVLIPVAMHTRPWLRHLSFNFNLEQIALAIFQPGKDITLAQTSIPIISQMVPPMNSRVMEAFNNPATWGAVGGLAVRLVLAAWVLKFRVKPE